MSRPSMGLSRINFYLEPQVLEAMKWLAATRGTTYSELLRTAAKKFVVEEIKKEQDDIAVMSAAKEIASG